MSLALRLALRDLRGGLAGLRLLAICLFLGVLALAGVGSLSAAIVAGLAERGQEILGGDVQLVVAQREATPEELAAFAREGRVSQITRMRAMAARLDGEESVLVELKGVDEAWPLLRRRSGPAPGAAAAAARRWRSARSWPSGSGSGSATGSGSARPSCEIVGLIAEEPDRVGQGFTLGSTALVDRAGLAATGLVQPGSLYTSAYRLKLPPGRDPTAVGRAAEEALRRRRLPGPGPDATARPARAASSSGSASSSPWSGSPP